MNRIKALRESRRMTQKQLGALLNVGNTAISQYEGETRQLDPATIHALCDLFGCTADYLLCRSSSPEPVISDGDARILAAYHLASLRDRALVDQILAGYMEAPLAEEKII